MALQCCRSRQSSQLAGRASTKEQLSGRHGGAQLVPMANGKPSRPWAQNLQRYWQVHPLDEAERASLKSYQYLAPALSLCERNGLDKFWAWWAEHVYPKWLAPNLITLAGGACVGVAMLLTLAHSPSLLGAAPGWVYATNAGLILSYQTLDGSDGKQARRTSSGSPIGELFDHGVDAWATGCIVFICIDAFAFGIQSPWPWLVLVGAQLAFFASNLTLLQTGRMQVDDMGVIELQSVMSICLCATAMYSPSIWLMHAPSIFGHIFEVRQLLAVGIIFNITKAVVGSVYNAFCHALDHGRTSSSSSSARNGHADVSSSARRASNGHMGLLQHCGIVATYACCVGASYSCLRRHGIGDIPMRLLWLCANSCFAEYLTRLLVERVTSRRLPALAPSLLWIVGFLGASLQPANLIVCALAASSAAVAHAGYFTWACSVSSGALGLHVFRVRGAHSWCRL